MKKVLGIMGSPRKRGNTHVLMDAVLAGARENGAATDLVLLGDLTIRECDGCLACWKGIPCPQGDDMNGLYPKIEESDVLVFGTPVYWYGPTALLKALVDRLAYFNCPENRKKIAGKKAVIVMPLEETDPDSYAPVVTFFEKSFEYLQLEFAGRLIVPGVSKKGDVSNKTEYMRQAYELGRNL